MSKMDNLRAMREARYEQAAARATKPRPAPKTPERSARPPTEVQPPAAGAASEPPGDEACGHRAISGRTCTREKGHAAKSHRYS
jgi:hypothetical protein